MVLVFLSNLQFRDIDKDAYSTVPNNSPYKVFTYDEFMDFITKDLVLHRDL